MPDIGVQSVTQPKLRTYLQLVQRLAQETGISKDPETSIPTIVGVTGETRRLADWISDAWRDIQELHDNWRFMRLSTTFATIDGQATYTHIEAGVPEGTLAYWYRHSFRSYNTAAGINGEIFMDWEPYESWRDYYQLGAMRSAKSQPFRVTITPDDSLGLGPVPLTGYTVLGDYQRTPVDLTADSDVPALPVKHSKMIIVYKAMEDHGYFEAAQEVLGRGQSKYASLLGSVRRDQLPEVRMAGPLA